MFVPFLAVLGAQTTSGGPQTSVTARPIVYHSLEAMIGPGERVFVGSINRLEAKALVVEVHEEFRGRGTRTISLPRHPDDPRDKGYARYTANHALYLFAVGAAVNGGWLALRLTDSTPDERKPDFMMRTIETPDPKGGFPHIDVKGTDPEKIFDDSMALPVLTMDLEVLRTPSQAIDRARRFLNATPITAKTDSLLLGSHFPPEIGPTPTQSFVMLDIPKTAALEALAKRMILAPKGFTASWLRSTSNSSQTPLRQLQVNGMMLLSEYPSKANRALLAKLLVDPNYEEEKDKADGKMKRVYPLRMLARQVLNQWDREEAPPPPALPKPENPGLFALVGAGTGSDEEFRSWGPDGKPSFAMSDFFAFARRDDSGGHSSMKIPDIDNFFKTDSKRRTRYVALRPPEHLFSYWTGGSTHFDTLDVGRFQGGRVLGGGVHDRPNSQNVVFFRFLAPPQAREISFSLEMWSASAPSAVVPIRTGARASGGGISFEVGAIVSAARPADLMPDFRIDRWSSRLVKPEGPIWTVDLVQTGEIDALRAGNVLFQPMDRSGRPIVYVGPSSEPIDAKESALVAKEGEFEHRDDRPAFAIPVPEKPDSGSYRLATNIDPKALGSVAVWIVVHRKQDFGPIPLEPVGSGKPLKATG